MLKKTITYEDFSGETVSEDFFFHLSKAELIELELSQDGGLKAALERIIAAEDTKSIIQEFKNIILVSYGKKSLDGRRFIKSDEVRNEFMETGAYDALFMELITDTDTAITFVNGIVPAGLAEEAATLAAASTPETSENPTPPTTLSEVKEPQILTKQEVLQMPKDEFESLGQRIASGEIQLAE